MARLTDARRRGLRVLAARDPQPAFRSNETNDRVGYVYWQTSDWLVTNDYAVLGTGAASNQLRLTHKGRELARQEGL